MTVTAVLLLVFSAFTHAGWNLIGKRSRSNAGAFLIASGAGVVLLLPFVLLYGGATAFFTGTVWLMLLTTGFFQALYYGSLSAAYRTGDMSLVYPVARSSPAVFVAIFGLVVGRGAEISGQVFVGVALILLAGC